MVTHTQAAFLPGMNDCIGTKCSCSFTDTITECCGYKADFACWLCEWCVGGNSFTHRVAPYFATSTTVLSAS